MFIDLYLEINEGLRHGKLAKEVLEGLRVLQANPKIRSSLEHTSDEL